MNAAINNKRFAHRRWVSPKWWAALGKGDRILDRQGYERLLVEHSVNTGHWEGFVCAEPRTPLEHQICDRIGREPRWIGLQLHEIGQPLTGEARRLWEEGRTQ